MFVAAALLVLAQSSPLAPPAAPASTAARHPARLIGLPDEAIAYIPARAGLNPPLLVVLHGAGRRADRMIERLAPEANARGIVLLAPTSRGATWDTVAIAEEPASPNSPLANARSRSFSSSRDADRVEAAIAALAKFVPVDRSKTAIAGFSDGATFALAMGMSRIHAFSAVIAWSPGIAIRTASAERGRRVFISHGRRDPVLRFDATCGRIVPMLQSEGAAVSFLPFEGGHDMPKVALDTFFDAVFGVIPGVSRHPLPSDVEKCMRKPDAPMAG
jgi:predicted esterase